MQLNGHLWPHVYFLLPSYKVPEVWQSPFDQSLLTWLLKVPILTVNNQADASTMVAVPMSYGGMP